MNELRAITTFVRAATLGNIRKAAVDQGISPQAASHAVMQLEKSLGVRLFHRTTRRLSLTEEGQRFLDAVNPALAHLSNALIDATRSKDEVAGVLRVSAPRSLGLSMLWPIFADFSARYPQVQLDVQFDDRFTDLVAERADVGVRAGSPPAAGLIARQLLPVQLIVCAAPSYLERHGAPVSIDALAQHRCTGYRRVNTGKLAPWEFQVGKELIYREVAPSLCTNDVDAEVHAVLSGLAIGQLASFAAVRHIRSGALVPLLMQHVTQREGVYLFYRHRAGEPRRVRTFIDFMVEQLAGNTDFYLDRAALKAARAASASGRAR
ncbi:LysR family transcriptional regulator [Trinickia sp. LjRoot230]|uniref:LysR family transcriptional regulator n=1 Tax=Trinickia sp. LjRoot230 TaxID=3342288 RepID=UPI003ECD6A11